MDFTTKTDELLEKIQPLNVKRKKLQNIIQVLTLEYNKVSDELLYNVANIKFLNNIQTFCTQEVAKMDDFNNNFQTHLKQMINKCLELNLIIPHIWNHLINSVIQSFTKYEYKYNTEQYKYTYTDLTIEDKELLELLDNFKSYIVESHYLKVLKDTYDYSHYLKDEVKDKYQEMFYDLLNYSYDKDLNLDHVLQHLNHTIYWHTKSYNVPFSLDYRNSYDFIDRDERLLKVNTITYDLAKLIQQGLTRQKIYDVEPLKIMLKQLKKNSSKRKRIKKVKRRRITSS